MCLSNMAMLALTLTVEPGGMTVDEALARVRAERAAGDEAVATIVVKGTNRLVRAVTLTDADHDLNFIGEKGAAISGALALTHWKSVGEGVVETDAPKGASGKPFFFDQLWVNGRRAPCARLPNEGWLRIASATQIVERTDADGTKHFTERIVLSNDCSKVLSQLDPADLPAVEVGIICKWSYGLRSLAAYDAQANAIETKSVFPWRSWKRWDSSGTLVALMNVRSAFDAPGEWFLDLRAGKVRYRLLPGETAASVTADAANPALTNLVVFCGDYAHGRRVRNVTFKDIAFLGASAETEENGPHNLDQYQAAVSMPGALSLQGVSNIVFDGCEFAETAGYGLRFGSGCLSNAVVNCHLHDIGSGGIWMGADFNKKNKPQIRRQINLPTRVDATAFNLISNNVIECGGRYNPEGTGVALTHCSDTKVIHNDIRDFYYSGVSVGWTWGFSGSVAQRNEIAWNRIADLGKHVMSDMGGVYTLGTSFGTTVHDNIVHDVYSFSYGGWALYCDEGSEGIVMERNLCWNTTDGGFHQHYGTGCIIRNNIFAFNEVLGAVRLYRAVVQDIPCSLHFLNNIVYVDHGPLVGKGARNVGGVWADNVWYDARGEGAAIFDEVSWSEWVKSGRERNSVFADPLFVNPKAHDFTLKSDSPAFRLGFRPFDVSAAGAKRAGGSWGAIGVKAGEKIAFLGDSITQFGNYNDGGYVNLVMNGLAQCGVKAVKIPAGVSGNKSNQMLARLQRDVLDKKPDWMVLSCGVNDVGHGKNGVELEPYKTNITAIVNRCRDAGVKVIVATPTLCTDVNWQRSKANEKLEGYCEFLRTLAAERNLPLADLNRDERALLSSPACPKAGLTFDHLHMNGYGNVMMAKGILRAMGLSDAQLAKCESVWRKSVRGMQPFGMHWTNWNESDRQIPIEIYEEIERKATENHQSVKDYLMDRINAEGRPSAHLAK